MARNKNGYKQYRPGDPIHIVVTQEFADDANEFFSYCKQNGFNPSQIIRQAIIDWLRNQKMLEDVPSAKEIPASMDDRLVALFKKGNRSGRRMGLKPKSAMEILEGK